MVLYQRCFPFSILIWATCAFRDLSPNTRVVIRVVIRGQKVTKPTAPGTAGLPKACQGEHTSAPTLLPPQLSHLGHTCMSPSHWEVLGSQLGLGFQEPQSLQLQGHWGSKRHSKGAGNCTYVSPSTPFPSGSPMHVGTWPQGPGCNYTYG